jgi:hypothetical protein
MKLPAVIGAIIAGVLFGAVFGYLGYQAGNRRALGLQRGALVGSLDALERIRAGDIARGTALAEQQCFMSAVLLLEDEHYQSDVNVRSAMPRLISYRQSYRTNRTEWTPIEHRLESLLVQKP